MLILFTHHDCLGYCSHWTCVPFALVLQLLHSMRFTGLSVTPANKDKASCCRCKFDTQLGTIGYAYRLQADLYLGDFFERGLLNFRSTGHAISAKVQLSGKVTAVWSLAIRRGTAAAIRSHHQRNVALPHLSLRRSLMDTDVNGLQGE